MISLTGCTKEKEPDTIAANLLKQGTANPEHLIGRWYFVKYAYTKDGNTISDRDAVVMHSYPPIVPLPTLTIPFAPTPAENNLEDSWHFGYYNSIWYVCSLNNHLIKLTKRGFTLIKAPPNEAEIDSAFINAYSFVIKGNELIIYFKGENDKNLLIFKKQKELEPEIIAANLLKQGTADPKLLSGSWLPQEFLYTPDGIITRNGYGIAFGISPDSLPKLEIPDEISNDWFLDFHNLYRGSCSLTGNLISFSSFDSMTGMKPDPKEKDVAAAFRNAYSFVLKYNELMQDYELIIHFNNGDGINLLILTNYRYVNS